AKLQAIPEDSRSLLFRGLDSRISLEHVEGYFNVAQTVSDAITQDDAHLQRVAGECAIDAALSPDSPLPETCLDSFIDRLGLLTYRRPLVAMEHDELRSVATEGAAALGAREQVRALIVAALISPRFVNHVEIDGALVEGSDDLLLLSPYEMASRIAYTFWQSMPDEGLLEAAADGS